jgi:predicted N-formylglutamate amidohydrolase
MARRDFVLITCEHGGNRIPPDYRHLFRGHEDLLGTHRGYDPGALAMARDLAGAFDAPLVVSTVSRLLIDLNRSPGHPRLFSEATRAAPPSLRKEILARHYLPYRSKAESLIADAMKRGKRVVHISSHSFTPVLDGEVRNADIGLLYDPARPGEAALCRDWRTRIGELAPALRVRRNYPYTGKSDGFAAYLRRRFPADRYVGVELEINQAIIAARHWNRLRILVKEALGSALHDMRQT